MKIMKQHINSNQLKELSFEQVNTLGRLSGLISYPRTQEEWAKYKEKEHLTMYISLLEFLNIGQLIQILHERKVQLTYALVFNGTEKATFFFENLCDELWEDVKLVI